MPDHFMEGWKQYVSGRQAEALQQKQLDASRLNFQDQLELERRAQEQRATLAYAANALTQQTIDQSKRHYDLMEQQNKDSNLWKAFGQIQSGAATAPNDLGGGQMPSQVIQGPPPETLVGPSGPQGERVDPLGKFLDAQGMRGAMVVPAQPIMPGYADPNALEVPGGQRLVPTSIEDRFRREAALQLEAKKAANQSHIDETLATVGKIKQLYPDAFSSDREEMEYTAGLLTNKEWHGHSLEQRLMDDAFSDKLPLERRDRAKKALQEYWGQKFRVATAVGAGNLALNRDKLNIEKDVNQLAGTAISQAQNRIKLNPSMTPQEMLNVYRESIVSLGAMNPGAIAPAIKLAKMGLNPKEGDALDAAMAEMLKGSGSR